MRKGGRIRRKEKVRGWSTEEMKNKSSSVLVEDTVGGLWADLRLDECWSKIAGKNGGRGSG